MKWNLVKVGTEVTWETGDIRGKIVEAFPKERNCTVELTHDYRSPCGHVHPRGQQLLIPAMILRLTN